MNSTQNFKYYTNKLPNLLEKIFEYFSKLEIPFKVSHQKQNSEFSSDYPYRYFWIDYLKIGRKFFKKSENFSLKSTIDNLTNSSNSLTEFKVITNEEALLLEENEFLESLLSVLVNLFFFNFSRHGKNSKKVKIIHTSR